MKKAKNLALTLASIMLVGSLAACGGNNNAENNTAKNNAGNTVKSTNAPATEGDKTEPAEKVELSFWTLGSVNYEELAKEYTKEHPNVTIKIQNTGDQTAHHNNLTTALSANSGAPDIFQLEIGFMERLWVLRINSTT